LELTKQLPISNWTYTYIPPLLTDVLLQLTINHYFYRKFQQVICQKCTQHLFERLTILQFDQDRTKANHTLHLLVGSILFFRCCQFILDLLFWEKALHANIVSFLMLLLLLLNNRKHQYKLSIHSMTHIFLCINHKNRTLG
jgi:hypothetical protein